MLLSYCPVYAAHVKKINLDDAIQLSLSNNLDLQAARIEVELAKNGVKIANRRKTLILIFFITMAEPAEANLSRLVLQKPLKSVKEHRVKNLPNQNCIKRAGCQTCRIYARDGC